MLALLDGFLDATVPAAAASLPDLHPADALQQAQLGSDASVAVHLDEVWDAILALAAVPYAEKLAVLAQVVQA